MNYVGSIEKQASQAWKRHFGELGEESVNRLLHSGVFDRTKELKGLRRGTKGILRSNNAKMFRSPIKASAVATQATIDNTEATKGITAGRNIRQRIMDSLEANPAWGTVGFGDKSKLNLEGVVNTPKGLAGRVKDALGNDTADLSVPGRRKREDQKWLQAILERHEADEIRVGKRLYKNKDKNMVNLDGNQVVKSMYASHLSPEIVMREGANTALAPKGAQKYMHELRNIGNEFGPTEKSRLKDYGIEYGRSPFVKAKDRTATERAVKRDNMRAYRDLGYDV